MTTEDQPLAGGPVGLTRSNRIRFLAKDVAFYGVASVVNKSFFLVTLPLFTRYFTIQEYGMIDFLYVLILFLAAVTILGQDWAIARFFYDDHDPSKRRQIVSQSLAIQLGMALFAVGALWLVVERLPTSIGTDGDYRTALRLVILHLPFMVLLNFALNMLKWTFARRAFAFVSLGQAVANAALLIAAMLWFDATIVSVFAISLATRATFGVVGVVMCRQWLVRPRGPSVRKPLFLFALPFGVIASVGTLVPVLERTLVGSLIGSTELGLYAAGAAIAMIITLPIQAFQMAWGPFSLAIHREPGAASSFDQVLKGFTVLCCLAVVGLAAAAPLLVSVIAGAPFLAGTVVVFPLAMGFAVQGISWITELGIGFSKQAHLHLYGFAAFLMVAGASIALLAGPFGILGVAVGVMLAHITKAAISTALAQRAYPLSWSFGPISLFIVATGALTVTITSIGTSIGPLGGAFAAITASILILVAAWIRLFTPAERTVLSRWGKVFISAGPDK